MDEEKDNFDHDGRRIETSWVISVFEAYKKQNKNDFFRVRSTFISLMNTRHGIFARDYATREYTAFGAHSVK